MQAVLLASGQNTRVRHIHPDLPKAMFPLNERPYLDYQIDTLFEEGVSELIIIVYHQSHIIKDYLSDRPELKTGQIKIIERRQEYGPVGALADIEDMLQDKFFIFYCDVLFKTNLKEAYHKLDNPKFKALTFLTQDEFGMWDKMETKIDEEGTIVTNFNPDGYSHKNGRMDVGQLYKKSVLELLKKIPPEEEHINKNIWPELITNRQLTYQLVGPVFDIGTEKNYDKTREIFKREGLNALKP